MLRRATRWSVSVVSRLVVLAPVLATCTRSACWTSARMATVRASIFPLVLTAYDSLLHDESLINSLGVSAGVAAGSVLRWESAWGKFCAGGDSGAVPFWRQRSARRRSSLPPSWRWAYWGFLANQGRRHGNGFGHNSRRRERPHTIGPGSSGSGPP